MKPSADNPLTELLAAAAEGDTTAQGKLWSAIYDELRRIAQQQMAGEAPGRTLQPTALVHEAYLRLFGDSNVEWDSRRHFFGAAARAMRQIRLDNARKRRRLKRGGGAAPGALADEPPAFDQDPSEVLAINEALDELEKENPRQAEVVMLRYFAGLSEEEAASALGVSRRTVQTDWRVARAWLHRHLSKGDTRVKPDQS